LPDPLATAPIPDLTGWRASFAELREAAHQQPVERGYDHPDLGFPIIRRDQDPSQVFNIAIGTEF